MTIWLIPLFAFFIFGRFFSYFKNPVPLGYDPGIYLYLFKKYSQVSFFSFASLPDWLRSFPPGIPILGRIIARFISPEKTLVPLIIFFSSLLFLSVYFLAKKLWNQKTALWTVFIFTCSALQYRAYWYYYLKNIAALSFLIFAFYFLLSNSYWAILFAILVAYFHRPTSAFLLVTLLAGLIFEKKKRRFYQIALGTTLAIATLHYLPNFEKMILPLIRPIFKSFIPQSWGGTIGKAGGSFYNPFQALALSLPYLPLALYGLKKEIFKKKNLLITAPLVVSLVVVVFRLFFFRRFIIFVDLFLIFFAGYGVTEFTSRHLRGGGIGQLCWPRDTSEVKKYFSRRWKRFLTGIYIVFPAAFILIFIYKTGQPLITNQELGEIKMLNETEKDAYILVTSLEYTPWIYGWSDRRPIAPGFGEYNLYWTIPEWHQFWESGDKETRHQLLLKLPKPLYIFAGDYQPMFGFDFSGDCFQRINWRTWKFICEKTSQQ